MLRLAIDNSTLQMELAEAQHRLQQNPNTWIGYETVGRVLHWMKDASAADYFRQAIKYYPIEKSILGHRPPIKIGNYFRLAGESEVANNYFLRAYEMLKHEIGDVTDPTQLKFNSIHLLILVCYALKRFEETVMYGAILREYAPNFDPSLLAPNVALLAEAKLTNNVAQAERAIDSIASLIRKSRIKIQTSGDITPWDAYELGLEVLAEIKAANR